MRTNPYVGPRPFEAGDRDRFFGRDREIRQLGSLIVAKRAVVLYARSGAGKTSLLRAGLVPYLEERKRLRVLPIVRLRDNLLDDPGAVQPVDLYVRDALQSLLGDRVPAAELVGQTLAESLGRHFAPSEGRPRTPRLLIVDQLEELFQTHPVWHRQRAEVFVQLKRCLEQHPWLSLLLSLREDSIAELDPYAARFPDRLRTRFRLELLDEPGALAAIQEPARRAEFEIPETGAQRLVDDLRTVRVQRSDGSYEEVLGPHVEPVHLQVICRRLWQRQAAGGLTQRESLADPSSAGSVDTALTAYYDDQVAAVAATTETRERAIRDWLERCLITEQGIRGQVLQGVGDSQGLANKVVEALVDARLVRIEKRRGALWFELSHDRLMGPVRASNAEWREKELHWLQLRSDFWVRQGRPYGLLLRSGDLRQGLSWARAHSGELTPVEEDFLTASRRARRGRSLGWLAVLAILLLTGSLWRLRQERDDRQRELARGLAAQARSRVDEQLDLALLLALEANRRGVASTEARGSLLAGLQYQPRLLSTFHGHSESVSDDDPTRGAVWSVVFSPRGVGERGARLASGDLEGRILLWDAERPDRAATVLMGHDDAVLSLAFSAVGDRLVSAGRDRQLWLWELAAAPATRRSLAADRTVTDVVFDPAGDRHLITGDTGGQVSIWDLSEDPPSRRVLGEHDGWVTCLAVDPSGSGRVASGGTDQQIRVWSFAGSIDASGEAEVELRGHNDWITGLVWAPDGKMLASASLDRTVRRWHLGEVEIRPPLAILPDRLSDLAIRPDGEVLAAATASGLIYRWDAAGDSLGPPLAGNLALTRGLAFSSDGNLLAAGSGRSVLLWDTAQPRGVGSALGSPLAGVRGPVRNVVFDPGGELVAVAIGDDEGEGAEGSDAGSGAELRVLEAHSGVEPVAVLPMSQSFTDQLAFGRESADRLTAFTMDNKYQRIWVWDWRSGASRVALQKEISSGISGDPNRRELKSQIGDFARIFEKELAAEVSRQCRPARALAVVGRRVLAVESAPQGSAGNWIQLWDVEADPLPASIDPATLRAAVQPRPRGRAIDGVDCVRSLAIAPGGDLLAVGTAEGLVVLLTLPDLQPSGQPLKGHMLTIRALTFSSDGKRLAFGGDDSTVHVWNLRVGRDKEQVLVGHTGAVLALAFDPQSPRLASAGSDRHVMLWDLDAGVAVGRPLAGHTGAIQSLAFSPDGERLVSGGEDGAWLWQLGYEVWRQRACRIANRDLTAAERQRFLGNQEAEAVPACSEFFDAVEQPPP